MIAITRSLFNHFLKLQGYSFDGPMDGKGGGEEKKEWEGANNGLNH